MRKEDIKNTLAITLDQISKHSKREILLSDDDIDIMADRVLLLSPNGEKLERLREYCEKETKDGLYLDEYESGWLMGCKDTKEEVLSILNEKEEVFDVRVWLSQNANCIGGEDNWTEYIFKDFVFIVDNETGVLIQNKSATETLFNGKVRSKYFFEQLLKSLGIEI